MMISGLDQGKVASCHLPKVKHIDDIEFDKECCYFYQLSGAVCTRKLVEILVFW